MLAWITIQFIYKVEAYNITSNLRNYSDCASISTSNFSDSEYLDKEYLYYNCRLFLDAKTLAFYYDIGNSKVVEKKIVNSSFESVLTAAPKMCIYGYTNEDTNNIYERCTAFIAHSTIFNPDGRMLLSTPATIIINSKVIEHFKKEGNLINVDKFATSKF